MDFREIRALVVALVAALVLAPIGASPVLVTERNVAVVSTNRWTDGQSHQRRLVQIASERLKQHTLLTAPGP